MIRIDLPFSYHFVFYKEDLNIGTKERISRYRMKHLHLPQPDCEVFRL